MSLSGAEVGLCVESFWLSRTLTLARLAAAAAVQISASHLLQQLLLGPIQRLLVPCGEEEEDGGRSVLAVMPLITRATPWGPMRVNTVRLCEGARQV